MWHAFVEMSDSYSQLLDATIQHLESLKARGIRFIEVSPQSLTALNRLPRVAAPAIARAPAPQPKAAPKPQPAPSARPTPGLPLPVERAVAPMDAQAKAAAFGELRQRAMACVKCSHLAASRKNVVFGVGSID